MKKDDLKNKKVKASKSADVKAEKKEAELPQAPLPDQAEDGQLLSSTDAVEEMLDKKTTGLPIIFGTGGEMTEEQAKQFKKSWSDAAMHSGNAIEPGTDEDEIKNLLAADPGEEEGNFSFNAHTNLIALVKKHRVTIDGLSQKTDLVSAEASKSLLMAKCWLGKYLERLNAESPYQGEGNIKNEHQIPPTADTASIDAKELHEFKLKSQLEKLISLRAEIQDVIKGTGGPGEFVLNMSYKYLCEAKFHLGFELAKIKK